MSQLPGRVSLMAAGELRDAMAAARRGDAAAALHGLMSIDTESWTAIEHRLHTLGIDPSQLTGHHQP